MPRPYDLDCPVARSLEVVGDRWTLLIIREMLLGHVRYSELAHALPGIPPNLLADRLRLLEDEGLAARPEPRGTYVLTDKAHDLAPVLGGLAVWGMRYYDEPPSALARHTGCGGGIRLQWTCNRCGEVVQPVDVELESPAGASP